MMEKLFLIRTKYFRSGCVVAVGTALAFLVPVVPAYAQWAVYDGANHVQNVLIAARTLQQIDNQITSLANQAQMLVNQGRNLASLPLSTLSMLQSTISQTTALLAQAQNIAYSVQSVEQQ
ncbi:P-type conjugative transfer protein TrbJ, partial [Gluconacetobacter diazotrophicus]